VLSDAISDEVIDGIRQLFHKEPIFDIVQLHCALAALRLEEARLQRDSTLFERAQEHVDSAKGIQSGEMLPFMMQGMLDLAKVSSSGCAAAGLGVKLCLTGSHQMLGLH
jgi:hypothetical protein